MLGICAVEYFPRMNNMAFLRIPFGKVVVEFAVPASFVAVVPEHHTRMVYILDY